MPPPDLPSATAEYRRALSPGWSDYHRLLVVDDDGRSALAMQVGIHSATASAGMPPAGGPDSARFLCAYFRAGELPVVLADDDIVAPKQRWELRTTGLWADMICEQPFRHWSYGLEAFGLAIDEPEELLGRAYGQRVPLGWELDFEASEQELFPWDPADGYGQPGTADGLVLLADRSVPLHGSAVRQHWWGPLSATPFGHLDQQAEELLRSGPRSAEQARTEVALPMPSAVWWLVHDGHALVSTTVPESDPEIG
ncbi:MAG: hypothetical protein ACRBK7_06260 [Acidimicrobiales bacterium]